MACRMSRNTSQSTPFSNSFAMHTPWSATSDGRSKKDLSGALAISSMVSDSPALRRRRVLLVDDNADLLTLTADLFILLGYEVLTAPTGDEALDVLQQRSDVDLLFSDVVMPGVDGVQLAQIARRLHPAMRIILVSGFVNVPSGTASVHDFDFIPKPYRLSDITRLLTSDPEQ
ncbi:response regulator [Oxalobacteraceae bacterium OM1]|nr:response regulator [Oxalobacteraceae bacterium OM1]